MAEQQNAEKKFRTAFGGGYSKSDVNEYIASMQAEYVSIEKTLKNIIDRQKEQIDTLRVSLDTAEKTGEDLLSLQSERELQAQKIEALQAELEEQKALCAQEKEKSTSLEKALSEKEAELELSRKETEEARAAAAPLAEEAAAEKTEAAEAAAPQPAYPEDYELLQQKAEQFDRMSAHIGAMMLKANANAEDVMNRAKADAQALLDGVNAELGNTRTRAQSSADTLIAEVSDRVKQINRNCCDDIVQELEDIRNSLGTALAVVREKYGDINHKLDYARSEMEAAAGETIRKVTAPRILKNSVQTEKDGH